jgi:hypothetical protein
MNKEKIIQKVMAKIAATPWPEDMQEHNKKVRELAKKYPKLTKENAVEYAREWEEYHDFKVPKNPKTKKEDDRGTLIIQVQLANGDWYPVWYDSTFGGLYGEY